MAFAAEPPWYTTACAVRQAIGIWTNATQQNTVSTCDVLFGICETAIRCTGTHFQSEQLTMIQFISLRFPWIVDQVNSIKLLAQMRKLFLATDNPWKVPTTSRDFYNAFRDKEQQAYVSGKLLMCRVGKTNRLVSYAGSKLAYLVPVFEQIDELLQRTKSVDVLEVGCGNCINLVEIGKRYGSAVRLSGFDVSGSRVETAKTHFAAELDKCNLWVDSAINPVSKNDHGKYDLVFSMHCLEQIPYAVEQAVEGMWQRTRSRVVFIEPVWEFARPVQKLKLVRSDYVRTLLPTIKYLGYEILRAEPLGFESSQKNQSSLIVLDKSPVA